MATGMTRAPKSERRQAPRVAHRVQLSIVNPREVIQAETEDLSASGVYCTLSRFLMLMSKLELNFTLPDDATHVIRCTGVVVRITPSEPRPNHTSYQAAIFFSDLSERDRAHVTAFVQRRLQGAPERKHS